jgi:asparagine synthetase B (glutamine-hydrolysing)
MCSFAGFNFVPENIEFINYFNAKRGPDLTNIHKSKDHVFLHNLLSITGEFTEQPFVEDDLVVMYNGEIYNYDTFGLDCKSDGEIITSLYKTHGAKFFKFLDGEFAIVIYDFSKRQVFIATDTFATKPVWIGKDGERCIVASYESVIKSVGVKGVYKIPANSLFVLNLDTFELEKRFQIKQFDLDQHKDTFDDCLQAFSNSISKRTKNLREKVFIGLSSGYDSGVIACELNNQDVKFKSYSIKAQENEQIILKRHKILEQNDQKTEMIYLSKDQYNETQKLIKDNAEEFLYQIKRNGYITSNEYMTDDQGAVGLAYICSLAQKEGAKIYISGQGADEIFSDYGFDGNKIYNHSTFGGKYPENLETVFPWNSFYESTQVSYLAKEENIPGAFGIEGRYPFLDFDLVQEFLWLKPELKNKFYKSVLHQHLTKHNFPFSLNKKIGFGASRELKDTSRNMSINEFVDKQRKTMTKEDGTFSFGINWTDYVENTLNHKIVKTHCDDMAKWLDPAEFKDAKIIDVGCGSGLSSLCFTLLGCKELFSFDYDEASVHATKLTKQKFNNVDHWQIRQGSVLDESFVVEQGQFDIVYSWGVLHHTGKMWDAIKNAEILCKKGGYVWIALYEDGSTFKEDLNLKKTYNFSSDDHKIDLIKFYLNKRYRTVEELWTPDNRGMNHYHDAIDWIGGYPYEVANHKEVINFFEKKNYTLKRNFVSGGRGNSIFLFKKEQGHE